MLDLILSDAFCARSVALNLGDPPAIILAVDDDEAELVGVDERLDVADEVALAELVLLLLAVEDDV